MRTAVITLMKKDSDEIKVVSVPNRCNCELSLIQKRVLKDNPGWFVRKVTVR